MSQLFVNWMGPALSAVEAISMGAAIWNEAETAIVQGQIRSLWNDHKHTIQTVAAIYEIVDKLSFNDSLFAQLNTARSYSIQNWEMIAKEIDTQSKFLETIKTEFQDTLANRMNMTEGSSVGLGLSIFGFTLASLMFMKEAFPAQYEKVKANIKEGGRQISRGVRYAARKLKLTSVNEEGRIVEERVPPENIQNRPINSQAENGNNKGKWSKGTIAMNFIRVGFLIFMIYSFIKGRIHINQLRSQLQKDKQYFSDKGKFVQQLQHCIDATKILACDIANLAAASQAVIQDFHIMYLTKAFVENTSTSHAAERAEELTLQKFNLTDVFIDKTSDFATKINDSDASEKKIEDKLDKFLLHFKEFFLVKENEKAPNEIFLAVTEQMSSMIGKDSVMNKDLFQKQKNLFSVAEVVESEFKEKRKSKIIYGKKNSDEKMEIDKGILKNCEDVFKEIIIEDTDSNLRKNEQETLAGIIMNYCDEFHGTDKEGKLIYHLDLHNFKAKQTYAEILDQKKHESLAQNVPLIYEDKEKEEKAVNEMLKIAQTKAIQEKKPEFQDVADLGNNHPTIQGRYLTLVRVATGQNDEKGVPRIKLLGSKGLSFKIRGNYYLIQKEIVSGKETLEKH